MPFPYPADKQKADEFLYEFFLSTKTDPKMFDVWKNLNKRIGVQMTDLDLGYSIDCTSGTDVVITKGFPADPQIGLKLTSEVFHNLYSGRLNAIWAFSSRKVKVTGSFNMGRLMKLTSLQPSAIKLYRDFLRSKGLPE